MPINITVVIPFFHLGHERGSLTDAKIRLNRCIDSFTESDTSLTIMTNKSDLTVGKKNVVCKKRDIKGIFSPGVIRNSIILDVTHDYIFLNDSDLVINPRLSKEILEQRNKVQKIGKNAFEMYPCLYLTKEETERFDGDFQGCLESFLRGENHRVEGIALASSCLLLNREWFLQLGGFDEQFVGHGGEDLELIDRLTRHYPIGPRPDDYGLNIKAQHPGDYQGFRRYFSYYALPHLFAGRFLVHQWHPRPLTHPYHKRRAGNDQLLEQMLSRSESERGSLKGPIVPCNDLNGELPDFREWMIRLQEEAGYPVRDYPGLLRWQDGIGPKRPLWRKLRKLYLNPRAFFRDMFKPASL
ncbi:galactosyltransferase-related protein [Aeromonas salmonicida]|uniref:galactosyltransferase-related protein n=1 Tax=Aeromonas salmonicida TaxID=645 RepID=UPI002857BB1A|nr:galactosyltransferase-related protein [Aeromonas salmonicida]MDR7019301.1 putative glycosyltransferase involved in capsule biosynthesis [Aeromonas salmonicida]